MTVELSARKFALANDSPGWRLSEITGGRYEEFGLFRSEADAIKYAEWAVGRPADDSHRLMDGGGRLVGFYLDWHGTASGERRETCPACRGSGRYVGLSVVEVCGTCGGRGDVASTATA